MNSKLQISALVLIALLVGYFGHGLGHKYGILPDHDHHGHGSNKHASTETETMDMDEMVMMDMPEPIEVNPDEPIPNIEIIDSFQGMMGEYTFRINIENFAFTPESVDGNATPRTGHGHIYVNDQQAGRVYGEWIYVPGTYFEAGRNKVTVSLNANNHAFWTINDSVIEDTVFVEYESSGH